MLRSMVISETGLLERAARGLRGDGEKRIWFPSWWLRVIRSTPQSLAGQGGLAVGREEMRCIAAAGMGDADNAERTAVSEKGTIKSTFLPEALEAARHDLGSYSLGGPARVSIFTGCRDRSVAARWTSIRWLAYVTGGAHH